MIRTQELLAARRLDGGRQFFTRAIDFGFSKNSAETLRIWDRQQVLADIVRVIRTFRPDVVITRFSPRGGGHGHHTASAILAVEAFKLAGDPKAFPEQFKDLTPWQPKRILQNGGGAAAAGAAAEAAAPGRCGSRSAATDPVSGEPLGDDRRPQPLDAQVPGFGNFGGRGRRRAAHRVVPAPRRRARDQDIIDGVDTTWGRVPGGAEIGSWPTRSSRSSTRKTPPPASPRCWRCGAGWRRSPATASWTRSAARPDRSRAASASRWRRPCPRPKSCRARPWPCGTSRRCGQASRSAG